LRRSWAEVRYRWLLPLTRRSRTNGRAYARLVARVEYAADAERARVAARRIAGALGTTAGEAARIFRRCLASEALEEADTVFFMATQRDAIDRSVFRCDALPERTAGSSGTVYATLHFGSPVLGYLALGSGRDEAVSIVGRPLDGANPMPSAKRDYARGKVAWVERVTGRPFLGTDGLAMARAREELLAGRSLYTPVDVPGSVAGRAATVAPFGEPIRLASGLMTLARVAGADVVPVVTLSTPAGFTIELGPRLAPSLGDALLEETMAALACFVRAHPDEWWMWPYLESAA